MSGPEDDRWALLLGHFRELTDAWRLHRDTVNRALLGLSQDVFALRDKFQRDERARLERQQQLDTQLAALAYSVAAELGAIRRNQRLWLRAVVVLALVGMGLVLGWLLL